MKTETKTRLRTGTTILGSIKEAMKAVFEAKNQIVNNMDEVKDWDECIKNIDKCSSEDRDSIKAIMEEEKKIKRRKEQIKNARKSIEEQVKNPERRPNMKVKVVEKSDKELV